jgi:SNF2 family DNA or RNA helicase
MTQTRMIPGYARPPAGLLAPIILVISGGYSPAFPRVRKSLHMLTKELYPYQLAPVDQFLDRGALLVAYEMGTGKTAIAIACAEELFSCGDIDTCLVICQASLKYQWAQQIAKFTDLPTYTLRFHKRGKPDQVIIVPKPEHCQVIDGDPHLRTMQYSSVMRRHPRYVIMSYETVLNDAKDVRKIGAQMTVLDEASAIKTFRAKRTKKIKQMLRSPYRLALTGTPVENKPEELFSIMQWVDESALGRYDLFERAYIVRDSFGRVERYKNLPVLRERIAPAMARKSRTDPDVAKYLPDVDTGEWYVQMTPALREAYNTIARDLVIELRGAAGSSGWDMHAYYSGTATLSENTAMGRIMAREQALEMLLDHPDLIIKSGMDYENSLSLQAEGTVRKDWPGSRYSYDKWQDGLVDNVFTSPKVLLLREKIPEILSYPGNKILIFTTYREMLEVLEHEFSSYGTVQFHGGMNAQEKAAAVARYTSDVSCRIFLSSHAGAYGNDMHMANYLINYDLPWSAGKADQINGRHVRASSQFKNVFVRNLITEGTVEERKLALLGLKRRVGSAILDGHGADSQGAIENDLGSLMKHLTATVPLN